MDVDRTLTVSFDREGSVVDDHPSERLGLLFDTHHRRLFALACRMTGDREDARDLVQDTFLRVARAALPEAPAGAEAYLVRVLVRLCRDRSRRLRVRERHAAAVRADGGPPTAQVEDEHGGREPSDALWQAVGALPARRRAVLLLHVLEGRDTAQIAALLGVSAVTVRWHLHAGRRQLRAALEKRRTP